MKFVDLNVSFFILLSSPLIFLMYELFLSILESCWALTANLGSNSSSSSVAISSVSSSWISSDLRLERTLFHFLFKSSFLIHDHLLMSIIISGWLLVLIKPVSAWVIRSLVSSLEFLINPSIDLRKASFVVFKCLFISHNYSIQWFFWIFIFHYLME